MNVMDFLQGMQDREEGREMDPTGSEDYRRGYEAQTDLEQVNES